MLPGRRGLLSVPPMALTVLGPIEHLTDPRQRTAQREAWLDLWKQSVHSIP